MGSERYHRQLDIVNPDLLSSAPILVIGAGAVGSFTVLALAKMGCTDITVFDFDNVENHNLPNQFYREKDIDRPKVEALADIVKDFTGIDVKVRKEKYDGSIICPIVISAVDSMTARHEIWEFMKFNSKCKAYIDSRMGAEVMQIYCIQPCDMDDIRLYESNLFPQDEALPERCTAKAIMYTVLSIGSFICGLVKKVVKDEEYKKETTFDAKLIYLQ